MKGQAFTLATTAQTSYSATIMNSRNTECDDMDYNGDHFRITSYGSIGNSNGGIAWDVTSSGTGKLSFGLANVLNTDVSLINDANGTVYAVAVYTDGHRILMEVYKWSGGAFVSFGSTSIVAYSLSVIFGTSLKMDASYNGDFVIVWDDPNGTIISETGSLVGGTPTLSGNRVTINASNCSFPDVAIYNNSPEIAHISYLDYNSLSLNNGVLTVEDHSFSSLASGSASITSTFTAAAIGNDFYTSPRIASTDNSGNVDDWTVVYEDDYTVSSVITHYYIKSHNNSGAGTSYTYNNSSVGPSLNISGSDNAIPVVTYDYNGDVWVGWNFDDNANGYGGAQAIYPIVLKCDNVAAPVPFSGITTFWEVPDPLSNGDNFFAIGLSGRHSTSTGELFMSFNDIINSDINTKYIVISGATSLKKNTPFSEIPEVNNNDFGILRVFNEMGQQIFAKSGSYRELLADLMHQRQMQSGSFLALQFTDSISKSSRAKKIVLTY